MQISDHGNCEAMKNENGEILTNHTTFDVFCFLKAHGVKKIENGGLSNVAPTILKILGQYQQKQAYIRSTKWHALLLQSYKVW